MKLYETTVAVVLLAALAGLSSTALADDVHCPPNLGRVTIDGNVLVAAPCRLDETTVKGNVLLYSGGSLIARGANIDGNIQAENADFIDVDDTDVNGSIQLDNLVGDLSRVDRSTIGGSIQLKSNRSRLEVHNNTVKADAQAFSNTGGLVIADNVIDGNLQCKSNNPAPVGGNNRVSGNKEDQCENLIPERSAGSVANVATEANSSGGAGSMGPLASLPMIVFLILRLSTRRRGLESRY